MNFMSLTALIPLLIKWGPPIVSFVQTEAPKIHQFIADLEAALGQVNMTAAPPPAPPTFRPGEMISMEGPNLHNAGPTGTFTS
jgi:hypothetical protein